MRSDLEFTGERFVPGIAGEIAHEHWHRYAFARRFAAGLRVLDVACGEGYGSALLSEVAAEVVGVDIAHDAVDHARTRYAHRRNVRFEQGSAAAIPLADGAVDVVVSFETLEHLPRAEQSRMLAEISRVLTKNGILVLSVPNPVEYSQARNYRNLFHLHEPPREELLAMLGVDFPAQRWYRQRRHFGSAIWSEDGGGDLEAWEGSEAQVQPARLPAAMYHVIVAARAAAVLPAAAPAVSIFSDRDEVELARFDAQAAEVLRLDGLLKERDASLAKSAEHVLHLEALVAAREQLVVERDAQLADVNAAREASEHARDAAQNERDEALRERDATAVARDEAAQARDDANTALASTRQAVTALTAETDRLERAIAAQERIIAYRQSVRWWLKLPWLRFALWWRR
jgi:SAM-dependent methyltransferase